MGVVWHPHLRIVTFTNMWLTNRICAFFIPNNTHEKQQTKIMRKWKNQIKFMSFGISSYIRYDHLCADKWLKREQYVLSELRTQLSIHLVCWQVGNIASIAAAANQTFSTSGIRPAATQFESFVLAKLINLMKNIEFNPCISGNVIAWIKRSCYIFFECVCFLPLFAFKFQFKCPFSFFLSKPTNTYQIMINPSV